MKTEAPQEDPEIKKQQQAAANDKIDAIRERSRQRTSQSLRLFGSRWALAGKNGVPILNGG